MESTHCFPWISLFPPFRYAGLFVGLALGFASLDSAAGADYNLTLDEDVDLSVQFTVGSGPLGFVATDTNASDGTAAFTVQDSDSGDLGLTLAHSVTGSTLTGPSTSLTGGRGGPWTLSINPAAHDNGSITINVTATDDDDPAIPAMTGDPDDPSGSTTISIKVTFSPVNDPPAVTGGGGLTIADTVTEPQPAFASSLSITDVDHGPPGAPTTQSLTVTVTNPDEDLGILTEFAPPYTPPTGVTIHASTQTTLTISGFPTNVTNFLKQEVKFAPTENIVPGGTTQQIPLRIDVTDGVAPIVATVNLGITGINDDPEMGVVANPSHTFQGRTVVPFGGFELTDIDASSQATVTITPTPNNDGNLLLPDNPPVGGSINGSGVLTFSGTTEQAEAYIRTVRFSAGTGAVSFAFAATDDGGATVTGTAGISVTTVNATPEIAGITTSLLRTEAGNPIALFPSVSVVDLDGDLLDVTIFIPENWGTLASAAGTAQFVDGTDEYTLTGVTGAAATQALRGTLFDPNADRSGEVLIFAIQITDPGGRSAADNRTRLLVTQVDQSPTIGGIIGNTPASPASFAPMVSVTPFEPAVITDDDGVITVSVALDNDGKGTLSNGGVPIQSVADAGGNLQLVSNVAGLAIGDLVRVSGDGGDPSYNAVHPVLGVDVGAGTVDLDTGYSGDSGERGVWRRVRPITGYADGGTGRTVVTSTAHGLVAGSTVQIFDSGNPAPATPSYDGVFAVTVIDPNKFSIPAAFGGTPSDLGVFAPAFGPQGTSLVFVGSPDSAGIALRGIQFTVSESFGFSPDSPGGTTFTITANDGNTSPTTVQFSIILQSSRRNLLVTKVEDGPVPPNWVSSASYEEGDPVIFEGNVYERLAAGAEAVFDPLDWSDDASSEGTLRVALALAEENDTLTFALPSYPATIQLLTPLVIRENLRIEGPGADQLTLSGDNDGNGTPDTQILSVRANLVVEGVTFSHGTAANGGGLAVGASGDLTMRFCAVRKCVASQWGGGIDVDGGALTLENCLIEENSTSSVLGLGGGGVSIFTQEQCQIVNTTFSGNRQGSTAGFGGGALYAENPSPATILAVEVTHCTFAENRDAANAGTSIQSNVFGTDVRVFNSIVADGQGGNLKVVGAGEIDSLGGNISDDLTRAVLTQSGVPKAVFLFDQPSDKRQIDPDLGPLTKIVGPLAAHPLAASSAAIDGAPGVPLTSDARGVIRFDGKPDCGSFEFNSARRVVINEVHFGTGGSDFIELYVPRDSDPVNLSLYELWVDESLRHVFASGTIIQPGFGVVVSDNGGLTSGTPPVTPTVAPLSLETRGLVELRLPGSASAAVSVRYNGEFADLLNPAEAYDLMGDSITLIPQFHGFALVPHPLSDPAAGPSSPGRNSGGTVFGGNNAPPFASLDSYLLREDEQASLDVLANDLDADGLDRLVIVDVSGTTGTGADDPTAQSAQDATVTIDPNGNGTAGTPHRGLRLLYDPRLSSQIQALPVGAELVDAFTYTIIDITTGRVLSYANGGGTTTTVESPAHRLNDNDEIILSGSTGNLNTYDGTYQVDAIDADHFTIPVAFVLGVEGGSWEAVEPRALGAGPDDTLRRSTSVRVTILGANDPPTPEDDETGNGAELVPEDTVVRLMGDQVLAGSTTAFDTDPLYPAPRFISALNLLANDGDPDSNEGGESLDIVGVFRSVNAIQGYVQGPGLAAVEVTSASPHGLEDGDSVLISGYGGYPSYNGVHVIEVIDADTFSIATAFVDNNTTSPGVWVKYNPDGNLSAVSERGAQVELEIRADHTETNVVYNPRASLCEGEFLDVCLDGLPEGSSGEDSFYYAVEDNHGGISVAKITIHVTGVNDDPVPGADPSSLASFDELLDELLGEDANDPAARRAALADLLSGLSIEYLRPPASGLPGRIDATGSSAENPEAGLFQIGSLSITDEETAFVFNIDPANISEGDLLANDLDVDRGDVLTIGTPNQVITSREGATVTISGDGLTMTYDPVGVPGLDSLSREELIIDTFEVTVHDSVGPGVVTQVAIMVAGLNDTPQADALPTTAAYSIPEDQLLTIGPLGVLQDDLEIDQSGRLPDDRRILAPIQSEPTTVTGALFSTHVNSAGAIPPSGSIAGFAADLNPTRTVVSAPGHSLAAGAQVVIRGTGFVEYDEQFVIGSSNPAAGTFTIPVPFVPGTALASGTWAGFSAGAGGITRFGSDPGDPLVTVVTAPGHLLGPGEEVVIRGSGVPAYDRQFEIVASDLAAGTFAVAVSFVEGSSLAGGRWAAVRSTLTYDPRGSLFDYLNPGIFALDGLGVGQSYVDTLGYEMFDGSFIFANDDLFKVAADADGVTLDVLANDRNLTGITSAVTLIEVGATSNGGTAVLGTDADGGAVVFYAPEPNFVGDEVFRYTVEDEWGNRDRGQVTVRVTINQLNGNLQANHDSFAVALGQTPILNVLANDNIIPAEVGTLSVTSVTPVTPALQGVLDGGAVTPEGEIVFPLVLGAADGDVYTFTYEISGGLTARAEATVTVTMVDREDALFTRNDAFSVLIGSSENALDVLANDNILPGNGLPLTASFTGVAADLPDHGSLEISPESNAVLYSPEPGFIGTDSFRYLASDGYGGTGSADVTVTVGTLVTNCDFFVLANDAIDAELPVLVNDLVLDRAAGEVTIDGLADTSTNTPGSSLTLVNESSATLGTVELVSGAFLFDADAGGATGEATFYYMISGQGGGTAIGEVTVVVIDSGVNANPDFYAVLLDSEATDLDVLFNDTAIPARPLSIVSLGVGLDAPDQGGTVELVDTPNGQRIRYQPPSGFSGEETFTYLMTDSRGTDDAKVVVRVGTGDLYANADAFTVYYEVIENGPGTQDDEVVSFSLPVLFNDRILPDTGETLTITGVGIDDGSQPNAPDQEGAVELNESGTALIYTPAADPGLSPGFCFEEKFTYILSDGTTRRAEAQVTITVKDRDGALGAAAGMEVRDDAYTVASDSTGNVLNVLANDGVKPAPASGWAITSVSAPELFPADPGNGSDGGVAVVSGGAILYSPRPGFVGAVKFTYAVSDGAGGTGLADVTVKVGITRLCEDLYVVLSDTVENELDVLANDGVLPGVDPAADYVLADDPLAPAHGTAEIEKGVVLYTPDPGFMGTDSFIYWVVDDSGGKVAAIATVDVQEAGSDRSMGVVSVTVTGVNDAPRIDSSGATPMTITDKETGLPFDGVVLIEVDQQGQQIVRVFVTINNPDSGVLTNLGGFVEIAPGAYEFVGTAADATAALQGLTFVPMENWVTVTDPPVAENFGFTLSMVDDDPTDPLTATDTSISIGVTAVNDPPTLTGTVAGLIVYYKSEILAFAGVTITEVDDHELQRLTVDVALDLPGQGTLVSPGGLFVPLGSGLYRFVGTAAEATAAIRALRFVPVAANLQPGLNPADSEITRFTITVNDGFGGIVTDDTTTVTAIHGYIAEVVANDGEMDDNLGWSVAASANVVVAGAPEENQKGNYAGAAYVYVPVDTLRSQWQQAAKLTASDGQSSDGFGTSVGTSGNLIVVGAPEHKANGQESGAAYLYQLQGTSWEQIKKLIPFDGERYDEFGFSVAIDGDTVVVGARRDKNVEDSAGSVYVYEKDPGGSGNWDLVKKILAPVPGYKSEFGYSVAIDRDTLLVGSPFDDPKGGDSGSAYVFERNLGGSSNWGFARKIFPSDGSSDDEFGIDVDISGDLAVVGAHQDDTYMNKSGSAYVFGRDTGGAGQWGQIEKLVAPDGRGGDHFGRSIAIEGDEVVVGMPEDGNVESGQNESRQGAAYLFRLGVGPATLLEKIQSLQLGNNEETGTSVAIGGHTVAVGIPFERSGPSSTHDEGAVIIYRVQYNNAPVARGPIPDQLVIVGDSFLFELTTAFGDPDVDDSLTYGASVSGGSLPGWLSLDPNTGQLSGAPAGTDVGSLTVDLVATDEDGSATPNSFILTVQPSGGGASPARREEYLGVAPPSISFETHVEPGDLTAPRHARLIFTGVRFGVDNEPLRYVIEESRDLIHWNLAAGVFDENTKPGKGQDFVWTSLRPLSAAPTQFYRIRVERAVKKTEAHPRR